MEQAGSPHDLPTAAGQAAGYLFQCRYALLAALKHSHSNPQLLLSIEHLDDVAFEQDAEPLARLQMKHHVKRTATLTDSRTDLWKTLAIWAVEVASDPAKLGSQKLLLITTARAPEGSAASLLRGAGRNETMARDLLLAASRASQNRANGAHYAAFTALAPDAQVGLLEAVEILDNSPSLVHLEEPLKHELRLLAAAPSRPEALRRVEGWWWGRVAEALVDPARKHIAVLELDARLDAVRESLRADRLPVDFAGAEPPETTVTSYDRRMFVRQLRLIACTPKRIAHAKRDFYRAFEQRSKWTREFLLLPEELSAYETQLLEQWEPRFGRMTEAVTAAGDHSAPINAGSDLLYWVETDAREPLRNFTERDLTVGSFHMLAEDRRLGWHPDYRGLTEGPVGSDDDDEGKAA